MQGIGHCDLLTERECKDTTIPRSVVGLRGIACLFLSIKAITWDYRLEVGCCLERLKAGDKKIAPKSDFSVVLISRGLFSRPTDLTDFHRYKD